MPFDLDSRRGESRGAYTSVAQVDQNEAEYRQSGDTARSMESLPEDDFIVFSRGTLTDRSYRIRDDTDGIRPNEPEGRSSIKSLNDSIASMDNATTPTAHDLANLPRVSDKLPPGAFLIAVVELCERFAYYGLTGPLQNYMSNAYHSENGLPGALGLSQPRATALSNFFQFWCYITPTLGAVVADQYLGKYRTIKIFMGIYLLGLLVLFTSSLPIAIEAGLAGWGLVVAMAVIGLGTGGIKANVSPLIAEQVRTTKPFIRMLPGGKRMIVDPEVTVQRVYMVFYMCINVGSISAIATTTLELKVGFWAAYLLPLLMFCVGYWVLVRGKKRYVIKPPQGGVIGNCLRALWIALRNRGDLDAARPSSTGVARPSRSRISWDDEFIDELKTALVACKVFLFFPIYWVTYSQMLNNFVSQAGQMQLHALPNDILPNIDPVTIILLIPLLDRFIYPFLRTRFHLSLSSNNRIISGFLVAALAMFYAAGLQSYIYASPPCYAAPTKCPAAISSSSSGSQRRLPNEVHVAWQTPAYFLIALSEILASVTGLEVAYAKAPENMKSFIMSLFLLTSAGGSALGILIAPWARDPWLVWIYAGLGIAALAAGLGFWWTFRGNGHNCTSSDVQVAEQEALEMDARDI